MYNNHKRKYVIKFTEHEIFQDSKSCLTFRNFRKTLLKILKKNFQFVLAALNFRKCFLVAYTMHYLVL